VFLDRDGTLIEDRGHLSNPSQVVFFSETVDALRRLADRFLLFIVTNQSGVEKGEITREDADRVNAHVVSYLREHGISITETYVCPHQRASNCRCTKPNPYFLKKAEQEFGIDLSRSFTVGDHPHDVEFAEHGGAAGIYVLSGHGSKHRNELPDHVSITRSISQAVDRILELAQQAEA
jgi:D-glycero-D-manno-heptose 1,7-bisphosphate phosphatase